MASPFTTADPSDPGSGSVPPSEPSARYIDPRDMAANALWTLGNRALGSTLDLFEQGGRAATGDLPISMEPGPNQLSMPEFAGQLALQGLGIRGANMLTTGGAFDPATLEHFGVWHGTGADQPFRYFDNSFLSSGEGRGRFGSGWYRGKGFYVGEAQPTGMFYRRKVAGDTPIPVHDNGVPWTDAETAQNFYKPGTIIQNNDGKFDRVESFNVDPNDPTRWSTDVRAVYPNTFRINTKYGTIGRPVPIDATNDPTLFTDRAKGTGLQTPLRTHATMPSDGNVAAIGDARGWNMADPGGLLHINVIPEQHEFFDLDLPWSQQTPEIREKMTWAGLDPMSHPYFQHPSRIALADSVTGDKLRQMWTQDIMDSMGANEGEAKILLSDQMSQAGIPGNKFLDDKSRSLSYQPGLKHNQNFLNAPDYKLADRYLGGLPMVDVPGGPAADVGQELNFGRRTINSDIEKWQSDLKMANEGNWGSQLINGINDHIQGRKDLLDWMDKEEAAGSFSKGDRRTRNFVVFDPKDLDIRSWNGRKFEPVDHDPYDVTRR